MFKSKKQIQLDLLPKGDKLKDFMRRVMHETNRQASGLSEMESIKCRIAVIIALAELADSI